VISWIADWIPDQTPLFTTLRVLLYALVFFPSNITNSSTVGGRLETVNACVSKAWRAVLPTDWAYTIVAISALRVTEETVLV
jgi:hypothetical protein